MSNPFASPVAAAAPAVLVIDIPEDPNWEPIEFADVLPENGFFCLKIVAEKTKDTQVILSFEIQDADHRGKRLDKFMPDIVANPKATFVWRQLMMSLAGDKNAAKGALRYSPGMFAGGTVYAKTESFEKDGDLRTSVGTMVTKTEYDAAHASGKGRWPAVAASKPIANPTGVPAGFPAAAPGFTSIPQPQVKAAAPAPALVAAPAPAPAPIPQPAPAATGFKFPGMP